MAKTIPQLTDATTVNAGDEIVVQQGGITKRATAQEFINFSPISTAWNNLRAMLFYPDITVTYGGVTLTQAANGIIHKIKDRLFVGAGADFSGNFAANQGGFLNDPPPGDGAGQGANWAVRDAVLCAANDYGMMSVVGYSSNGTTIRSGSLATIGVSGFSKGVQAGKSCHGMYSDVQFEAGTYGYGIEVAVKNKSANNETSTPYFATTGTYGIWLPAGADNSYGGSAVNPCNTAIAIGKNASTWNKGIVFFADALTGTDGSAGSSTLATAIEMARNQQIAWRAPGNVAGFSIVSQVSTSASNVSISAGNNLISLNGGALPMLLTANVASAVNYLQITNRATGSGPLISALGSDTNIDLPLSPKGTGVVCYGTHVARSAITKPTGGGTQDAEARTAINALIDIIADGSAAGHITIKDSSGNTRKIAVVA
jgi:hypothetical protein